MVVFLMREIAIGNISVVICPICSLFKGDPPLDEITTAEIIPCSAALLNESTSYKNSVIVKGILIALDCIYSGCCRIGNGIEIIHIGSVDSRTPAGIKLAVDSIIQFAVHFNYSGGKISTDTACNSTLSSITYIFVVAVSARHVLLGICVNDSPVDIPCGYCYCVLCGLNRHVQSTVAVIYKRKVIVRVNRYII